MDEFEFLDRQFHRLGEARSHRYYDEQEIKKRNGKEHSAYETAELMLAATIRDYLKLRNNNSQT